MVFPYFSHKHEMRVLKLVTWRMTSYGITNCIVVTVPKGQSGTSNRTGGTEIRHLSKSVCGDHRHGAAGPVPDAALKSESESKRDPQQQATPSNALNLQHMADLLEKLHFLVVSCVLDWRNNVSKGAMYGRISLDQMSASLEPRASFGIDLVLLSQFHCLHP